MSWLISWICSYKIKVLINDKEQLKKINTYHKKLKEKFVKLGFINILDDTLVSKNDILNKKDDKKISQIRIFGTNGILAQKQQKKK